MAISTNGTVMTRLAGALYNTQMSNATYKEVAALDPSTLANALYARDFSSTTDATVATTLVTNLGLSSVAGLSNWVAAQLTAAGASKGAKVVELLNGFAQMTADTTYGAAATAYNNKVDNALLLSQTTDNTGGAFDAINTAVVGKTFTLTTGIDSIPSNSSATITGIDNNGGVAGGQTFQTGDVVAGAKSVNVTFTANSTVAADINNSVFNGTMLASAAINAALYDGVTGINNAGGGLGNTLTVTNGELASVYGIVGDTSAAGISAGIRAANLSGTSDTIKFSVSGVGSVTGSTPAGFAANTAVLTASSTGVEKISVATAGTNVLSITPTNTALTDYVALAVTGNGANTITASALTQVTTYDLSTSTGTNTLNLVGALQTSTTVTGGTGTDTLRIQPATTVANVTVSGVETLRLSSGATTGNTFFTTGTSFATIRQDGDGAEGGAQTINNVGAPTAINLIGAGTTALSGTAQAFNTLTVNSSWANASDAAIMKLSNGGTTLTAGIGYAVSGAVAATTLNGLEALTVEVTDIGATGATTFGGITGTTLSSLTATSAGHVVLGTITSAGALGTGTLSSINLSGVTGTTASTLTVGTATVGGALVITGAVNGTTVGGVGTEAAADSIIFSGNVGVDSFTGTGFLGSLVLDGKAGNDVLVGGSGADVITGGEGGDTITSGLAADTVVLTETVATADTIISTVGVAYTTATADTITGFTVGASGDILQIDISDSTAIGVGKELRAGGDIDTAIAGNLVIKAIAKDAATTLASTDEALVITGTFANAAALLTSIGTTGLITKNDTEAASIVVVWNNGTNTYVSAVHDAGTDAPMTTADLTEVTLVILAGVLTAFDTANLAAIT
jgi:hypothetical protein